MSGSILDLDAAARLAEPALVVLEADGRSAIGFLASTAGHVVTALSAVANASELAARLVDGRVIEITEVAAIDSDAGIAVLMISASNVAALTLSTREDLAAGEIVFAQAAPADGTTIIQTRAGQQKQASDDLLVTLLPALATSATGSPILDGSGEVVAIATRMMSNAGPVIVGIPVRYVRPLLEPAPTRPLSALAISRRGDRAVPDHPRSLLDGSSRAGLQTIAEAIVTAINVGAPAYNEGDIEGCYRIYLATAELLVNERADCPGAQQALRDGLQRARALPDPDGRAWALRDAFDGLLTAIERWLMGGSGMLN